MAVKNRSDLWVVEKWELSSGKGSMSTISIKFYFFGELNKAWQNWYLGGGSIIVPYFWHVLKYVISQKDITFCICLLSTDIRKIFRSILEHNKKKTLNFTTSVLQNNFINV